MQSSCALYLPSGPFRRDRPGRSHRYDRFETPPGSGPADRCYGLYFESQDGIEWDAPELDVCFRPEGLFVPRNVFWALPDRSVHISVCALPEEGGWWAGAAGGGTP